MFDLSIPQNLPFSLSSLTPRHQPKSRARTLSSPSPKEHILRDWNAIFLMPLLHLQQQFLSPLGSLRELVRQHKFVSYSVFSRDLPTQG